MKGKFTIPTLFLMLLLSGCGNTPSDTDRNTPDDTTPPSAPVNFTGSSGNEMVELMWDASGESDLEGYNLYRSEASFSSISSMDPVNGTAKLTGTNYTDDQLHNGTTYFYRLTAVDASGNESSHSGQVEVTPFSNPPSRPKN